MTALMFHLLLSLMATSACGLKNNWQYDTKQIYMEIDIPYSNFTMNASCGVSVWGLFSENITEFAKQYLFQMTNVVLLTGQLMIDGANSTITREVRRKLRDFIYEEIDTPHGILPRETWIAPTFRGLAWQEYAKNAFVSIADAMRLFEETIVPTDDLFQRAHLVKVKAKEIMHFSSLIRKHLGEYAGLHDSRYGIQKPIAFHNFVKQKSMETNHFGSRSHGKSKSTTDFIDKLKNFHSNDTNNFQRGSKEWTKNGINKLQQSLEDLKELVTIFQNKLKHMVPCAEDYANFTETRFVHYKNRSYIQREVLKVRNF